LSGIYPHVYVVHNGFTVFWQSPTKFAYGVMKTITYKYVFSFWLFLIDRLADLFNSKGLCPIRREIYSRAGWCPTEKIFHILDLAQTY
jgi:hypothetical protein